MNISPVVYVVLGCLALALHAAPNALAQEPARPTLELWPGVAPGDEPGKIGEERDMTDQSNARQRGVIRLGNVSRPMLTVFQPPREKANGAAVVVCPGG